VHVLPLAAQLQEEEAPAVGLHDQNNIARRFVKMGRFEAEGGSCDKALESFRRALEIAPDNEDALAGIASCRRAAPGATAAVK
jgi:cytochrome c-type biogenesis protein CcmH/NrfG